VTDEELVAAIDRWSETRLIRTPLDLELMRLLDRVIRILEAPARS
jgi:hypothetical protein